MCHRTRRGGPLWSSRLTNVRKKHARSMSDVDLKRYNGGRGREMPVELDMIEEKRDVSIHKTSVENKNTLLYILLMAVLAMLCVLAAFQIKQMMQKELTPQEILASAEKYVIEIKTENDGPTLAFGSGVVISEDGLVVTNYHVVSYLKDGRRESATAILGRFCSEEEYRPLTLLEYDLENDTALLKLESVAEKFSYAKLREGTDLEGGERVYAVGNTSNYGISISEGIIGVPLVNIEYSGIIRSVIQCDINIAEGNSGGALIDSKGQLIGITSFRTRDKSGNIVYGICYCVPVSQITDSISEWQSGT